MKRHHIIAVLFAFLACDGVLCDVNAAQTNSQSSSSSLLATRTTTKKTVEGTLFSVSTMLIVALGAVVMDFLPLFIVHYLSSIMMSEYRKDVTNAEDAYQTSLAAYNAKSQSARSAGERFKKRLKPMKRLVKPPPYPLTMLLLKLGGLFLTISVPVLIYLSTARHKIAGVEVEVMAREDGDISQLGMSIIMLWALLRVMWTVFTAMVWTLVTGPIIGRSKWQVFAAHLKSDLTGASRKKTVARSLTAAPTEGTFILNDPIEKTDTASRLSGTMSVLNIVTCLCMIYISAALFVRQYELEKGNE